jgi:hypothetical protein
MPDPPTTPAVGHVFFAPVGRIVFAVADVVHGAVLRLWEPCGFRGARTDAAALPAWLEDLGHPGELGPEGWMALRDGVLAATDHTGRVEAVRTAAERAKEYGPAGRAR